MGSVTKRVEKEHRLTAALAFAKDLEERLSADIIPSSSLATGLYKHVDAVLLISKTSSASKYRELDSQGTKLWNLISKHGKGRSINSELTCLLRVFSCLLLDCAQRWTEDANPNDVRVLRLTLRASKYCLDQHQLSLAERVVERAAFYEEKLTRTGVYTDYESAVPIERLSKEYQALRIALAWQQNRLDLAELMFTKLGSTVKELDNSFAETLADLLFEIGNSEWKKSSFVGAVSWLEKAYDVLAGQDREVRSSDAGELQASIMHLLARALVKLPGPENRNKAWNIVGELEVSFEKRLVVLLLKLELYALEPSSSAKEYCGILQQITRSVHLTDSNLKTILHHVYKLREQDPLMAHTSLETLLLERLVDSEELVWLENVLLTMTWNCTASADFAEAPSLLSNVLDSVFTGLQKSISPPATHAAHILLWKRIAASFTQQVYERAEVWCRLALHEIFDNSGILNVGKLQRKLMLCALGMSNLVQAREIYTQMSQINQRDPSTQYLLYKIALRSKNQELAIECLDSISGCPQNFTVLYACVLEAQQAGEHILTIKALQRVPSTFAGEAPDLVHLPTIIRCTASLLLREIENEDTEAKDIANEVCQLFDAAAAHAQCSAGIPGLQLFPSAELSWFSRKSYNLAVKVCTHWDPPQTLRLVRACLKFIDLFPTDMDTNITADLSLHRQFCSFLGSSLLVVMARNESQIETQLQHYGDVRKYVDDFRTQLPQHLTWQQDGTVTDLLCKYSCLLAFDMEAAVGLESWDSLDQLIQDFQECRDYKIYSIAADIILSSAAPSHVIIATLQQIINATWRLEASDIEKLSRWIRCLFSLALTSRFDMVEHLLDQVVTIAGDAKKSSKPYPAEELEWIATTTYNKTVDFYSASQDAECRRWAEKALSVAQLSDDGGALYALLQHKFTGLTWGG